MERALPRRLRRLRDITCIGLRPHAGRARDPAARQRRLHAPAGHRRQGQDVQVAGQLHLSVGHGRRGEEEGHGHVHRPRPPACGGPGQGRGQHGLHLPRRLLPPRAHGQIPARLRLARRTEGALPPRRSGRREGQAAAHRRAQRDARPDPRPPQGVRGAHRGGLPHPRGGLGRSPRDRRGDARRGAPRHAHQLLRRYGADRAAGQGLRQSIIKNE